MKELIRGRNKDLLLTALVNAGILKRDTDQFSKGKKLPVKQGNVRDGKKTQRVYWLTLPEDS